MRLSISMLLLILTPLTSWGFQLQLEPQGLSSIEREKATQFINEVERALPSTLKQRLNKNLKIRFAPLSAHGETRVSGNSITLSKNLLSAILDGPAKSAQNTTVSSQHKTQYDIAFGTLIHEIAHHYDFHSIKGLPGEAERTKCLNQKRELSQNKKINQNGTAQGLPEACYWYSYQRNVSDNPQFVYALSWNEKELAKGTVINPDDQVHRSPNPYEFKSKEEAFAVNFEFYLMDPEYKCRRPTAYNFLKKHFQHEPHASFRCDDNYSVVVNINNATQSSLAFEKIDISRIYEVHYLLAGSGDALMSNWGHAMLRLVICAPHRKTVDESCLKDLSYHRVISYRAGIADLAINQWKGLTGGYPSQIFVLPFLNVINEYTKLEMRSLYSYPLTMNRTEISDFVTRVIEQHWSYRGKYYFLTNNCAVETLNILKQVRPSHTGFANVKTVTPMGVRDHLIKHGYARSLTTKDFTNKLHFWPSKQGKFKFQLDELNSVAGTKIPSVEAFLQQSTAVDQALLQKLKANGSGFSSFLTLEMLKIEKMSLRKMRALLDHESQRKDSAMIELLKKKAQDSYGLINGYFKGGYGIPSEKELELSKSLIEEDAKSSDSLKEQAFYTAEVQRLSDLTKQILGENFVRELSQATALANEAITSIKDRLK